MFLSIMLSCFCSSMASLVLFFFIHLRTMQLGAAPISPNAPIPSVDDLADQVADVLDFFG